MSLQQRPLTAYFGAPDSKFAKGIAAVPVSIANKTNVATKTNKENEVPGSNASKIETAKGSPSVKKVVKTTKSSAAKEAGASPAASTTGPSPCAKPNKKAKSTSSTARKVPVAKKSKTAKKAPPAPKVKKAVSSLSLSPKKPTAGVKNAHSVKKRAKPSELLSTDTPGVNAAASKSVPPSTKKQTRKVMHSVSVDGTKTATAVPLAANEKQAASSEASLLKSKEAGTNKTLSEAPKVKKATMSESTVVSDNVSIKEPPSGENATCKVPVPKSRPVVNAKAAASFKILFSANATVNASETPPSMGKASDSAESNPSNDAVISPSSPGRSATEGTRVKPTKSKAPVARKTKAAKRASPALKLNKESSSNTSGGKSMQSDRTTVSFVPTTEPNEHQFAQSASHKVISSAPIGIASTKCSRSVDNAIEIITPLEANPSYSSSNAKSETGVMPHLTAAVDVLRHSTESTEIDARDATPHSVSMGSIILASEMSSRQRAGNALSIVENAVEKLPRISAKLTLAMLKEEAVCRGLVLRHLPRTKMDLLSHLMDGSIHLTGTRAWKEVKALKVKMREEQLERDKRKREDEQTLEDRRREEEIESLALSAKMHEEQQALANERRAKEIESQTVLHIHNYPRIHLHPLAQTTDLLMNGMRRAACCKLCSRYHPMQWTCEMCNFDICYFCFKEKNMTDEERERESQEQERRMILVAEERAKERQECEQRMKLLLELREADEKERQKKREAEKQNLLDRARQQFKLAIICPSKKNEDLNGNKLKGFTVWCSLGEGWDGPPRKEFDSTWKSSADANNRARYLFFWKNTFDWDPEDMMPDEESEINGLVYYSVQPDDDQCWSVGVVPDVAFLHLPDASSDRHNHDRDYH